MKSVLLPALEFMRTDKNAEPDPVYIKEKLRAQLELYPDMEIYITQGFICRNAYGEIDNLGNVVAAITPLLDRCCRKGFRNPDMDGHRRYAQ